jgi:hypothetical protein
MQIVRCPRPHEPGMFGRSAPMVVFAEVELVRRKCLSEREITLIEWLQCTPPLPTLYLSVPDATDCTVAGLHAGLRIEPGPGPPESRDDQRSRRARQFVFSPLTHSRENGTVIVLIDKAQAVLQSATESSTWNTNDSRITSSSHAASYSPARPTNRDRVPA